VLRAGLVSLLLVAGSAGFVVAVAASTLPSIDGLGTVAGSVRILDRNGALIAQVGLGNVLHETVSLRQVAPVMQEAIIAAEDRQFYAEGAVDPGRILVALVIDIVHGRALQGASTITQQLARNAFLPGDTSRLRKLREALIADEINQRYTKPQILEMYLNSIYFGHGAYGVEEAAQTYFGVHASGLTLAESALIAGLPQAPSIDDPYLNSQAALARMHYVLDGMVGTGAITRSQAAAVDPLVGADSGQAAISAALVAVRAQHKQAILGSLHDTLNTAQNVLAPHFVTYVRDQLDTIFQSDPQALTGVVTVQTSLDLKIQQQAQQAVRAGVAAIGRNANNGALLMLDSHTGDILAMVGSANYYDSSIAGEFNVVTAERQPGSSFKPYVYEAAFKEGAASASTTLDDTAQESHTLGGVQDWDGNFMGPMPAAEALLLSRNVPTEQLMERAGTANVINFAHSLGISSDLANNASTAIGSSAVRMIDHAAAYAAFANGGTTVQPRAVLRVTGSAGQVLYAAASTPGHQVMTPQQAYSVTGILRQYNAQWGDGINRDIACKSGTTDNYTDAWFMAYSPDWVVATWVGHTSGSNPAEVGMNTVYGNDAGHNIAAPFINGLAPSAGFVAPPGSPSTVIGNGGGSGPGSAPKKKHGHG
jgi:penicillin-binding protein 1A